MVPNDIVSSLIAVQMGGTGGGGTYLGLITLEEMDKLPVLASIEYGEYRTDFKIYTVKMLNDVGSGYNGSSRYIINVYTNPLVLCRMIYKNGTAVYGSYVLSTFNFSELLSYNYNFDSGKAEKYYGRTYTVDSINYESTNISIGSGGGRIKLSINYTENGTYYNSSGGIDSEYQNEGQTNFYQYIVGNNDNSVGQQVSVSNLSESELVPLLCEAEKALYETYST